MPYPTIVALNEKAGILHYDKKRKQKNGDVLLLDAGANSNGYASDITRTYARNRSGLYFELLEGLERLHQTLLSKVASGVAFIELHHKAHLGIAKLLKENEIIAVDGEPAIERGITKAFFPHGLGHMLGLQVHDVGNVSTEGIEHPLRNLYPKLRTNASLAPMNVTTIEPGIYFIPTLLAKLKETDSESVTWEKIETLMPYGGMRIEDDVVVTENGSVNLTREFLS